MIYCLNSKGGNYIIPRGFLKNIERYLFQNSMPFQIEDKSILVLTGRKRHCLEISQGLGQKAKHSVLTGNLSQKVRREILRDFKDKRIRILIATGRRVIFTMKYKQGDVVLVEVIFSEGSGVKKRPALIISDKYYHNHRQEVVVSAITKK